MHFSAPGSSALGTPAMRLIWGALHFIHPGVASWICCFVSENGGGYLLGAKPYQLWGSVSEVLPCVSLSSNIHSFLHSIALVARHVFYTNYLAGLAVPPLVTISRTNFFLVLLLLQDVSFFSSHISCTGMHACDWRRLSQLCSSSQSSGEPLNLHICGFGYTIHWDWGRFYIRDWCLYQLDSILTLDWQSLNTNPSRI